MSESVVEMKVSRKDFAEYLTRGRREDEYPPSSFWQAIVHSALVENIWYHVIVDVSQVSQGCHLGCCAAPPPPTTHTHNDSQVCRKIRGHLSLGVWWGWGGGVGVETMATTLTTCHRSGRAMPGCQVAPSHTPNCVGTGSSGWRSGHLQRNMGRCQCQWHQETWHRSVRYLSRKADA